VITLLDLRAPNTRGVMLQQLLHQWQAYVAYLASFAYAGVIWVNHHQLFTRIAGVDTGLLWRNLALLLTTSVLPFPTAVLGSAFQHGSQRDQTVGLVFCALVSAAMAATWLALFHHLAMNGRLLASNTTVAFFARERRRALIGIATYLGRGPGCPVGAGRRIDRRHDAARLLRGDQRRPASNAPSQGHHHESRGRGHDGDRQPSRPGAVWRRNRRAGPAARHPDPLLGHRNDQLVDAPPSLVIAGLGRAC
jgi:Endosomal/lysosomal potassium channel TMEM175